jgi:hypothetical protein
MNAGLCGEPRGDKRICPLPFILVDATRDRPPSANFLVAKRQNYCRGRELLSRSTCTLSRTNNRIPAFSADALRTAAVCQLLSYSTRTGPRLSKCSKRRLPAFRLYFLLAYLHLLSISES